MDAVLSFSSASYSAGSHRTQSIRLRHGESHSGMTSFRNCGTGGGAPKSTPRCRPASRGRWRVAAAASSLVLLRLIGIERLRFTHRRRKVADRTSDGVEPIHHVRRLQVPVWLVWTNERRLKSLLKFVRFHFCTSSLSCDFGSSTSPTISRFSAPNLSSLPTTSPISATIHSRSPFHFDGSSVAWSVPAAQSDSGPFVSCTSPGFTGSPLPPLHGRPSVDDFQ